MMMEAPYVGSECSSKNVERVCIMPGSGKDSVSLARGTRGDAAKSVVELRQRECSHSNGP